jgi:hypothetical protein
VFCARFGGESVFERCVLMKSHSGTDKEGDRSTVLWPQQTNFNSYHFHLIGDASKFQFVCLVASSAIPSGPKILRTCGFTRLRQLTFFADDANAKILLAVV